MEDTAYIYTVRRTVTPGQADQSREIGALDAVTLSPFTSPRRSRNSGRSIYVVRLASGDITHQESVN